MSAYDLIFIPGGMGTTTLIHDTEFINWLKTAEIVRYKVSVCTGSLLLGASGFLEGKKATTHPNAFDLLGLYTDTGGGVATSVDLGLYLCELFAVDYPYYHTHIVTQ